MRFYILKTYRMKTLYTIALILVIVGGLNRGLVGIFDFNLVSRIFGDMSSFSRVVYTLVGLSGLYIAISCTGGCESGKANHNNMHHR